MDGRTLASGPYRRPSLAQALATGFYLDIQLGRFGKLPAAIPRHPHIRDCVQPTEERSCAPRVRPHSIYHNNGIQDMALVNNDGPGLKMLKFLKSRGDLPFCRWQPCQAPFTGAVLLMLMAAQGGARSARPVHCRGAKTPAQGCRPETQRACLVHARHWVLRRRYKYLQSHDRGR